MRAGPKRQPAAIALPPLTAKTPAGRVLEFFERELRHTSGAKAGQPLRLALWQRREIIQPIFGTALGTGEPGPIVLAGGDGGIFISRDRGRTYRPNGRSRFDDRVPLPRNWLFCSGKISLDVVSEAAEG